MINRLIEIKNFEADKIWGVKELKEWSFKHEDVYKNFKSDGLSLQLKYNVKIYSQMEKFLTIYEEIERILFYNSKEPILKSLFEKNNVGCNEKHHFIENYTDFILDFDCSSDYNFLTFTLNCLDSRMLKLDRNDFEFTLRYVTKMNSIITECN